MPHPIVHLVQTELVWFKEVRTNHPELFPDQSNLHPIPFFGDIRRAEVLTLALNPARTEFEHGRYWLPNKDEPSLVAPVLTTRLLHYFDLPVPASHEWFRTFEDTLRRLDCSYRTNAALLGVTSPVPPTRTARRIVRPFQGRDPSAPRPVGFTHGYSLNFSHWQDGYGAFTVSHDDKDGVIEYIKNQPEHHQKVSFQDELRAFLMKHGVKFNEKYLV